MVWGWRWRWWIGKLCLSARTSHQQAMYGNQSDGWQEAATLEYNTLVEISIFKIIDLPVDQKAIGSGWVFWVKHNANGSIEHLKARIIAKEYSQHPGLLGFCESPSSCQLFGFSFKFSRKLMAFWYLLLKLPSICLIIDWMGHTAW